MNTIVALATSVGRSAIGVIRLSGPEAIDIARNLIGDKFDPQPGSVQLKSITNPHNHTVLDQALVTYFKAPSSFTGEDIVELSCHGSPVILRQVLDLTLQLGARLADPGEFTLRALSNGKINLSQAEAIRDLIDARTSGAARQAVRQLNGELSAKLSPIKERVLEIIVLLESALEFAEDDLPELQRGKIGLEVKAIANDLDSLASTFSVGHLLADGLKVAIVGRPNVGKSSLFNGLLGLDRAIVTDIPGTTRDSINEQISLEGIPVLLTDTAGMREAGDSIETIGIERTHRAIADADLLLVVIDGSMELEREDMEVLAQAEEANHIVVLNKCDVPSFQHRLRATSYADSVTVELSALNGSGLDKLRAAILEPFGLVDSEGMGLLVTNARHHDLLRRSEAELGSSAALLGQNASEELVLVGLHNALRLLGEVTGETTTEDILSQIFSTFCIGK
ncbi:MAG: tRNA uridine-5-carboxymethylaminomethyl(34) synthesis GTPase MnmE [Pyrinomonadaceae bacterium]